MIRARRPALDRDLLTAAVVASAIHVVAFIVLAYSGVFVRVSLAEMASTPVVTPVVMVVLHTEVPRAAGVTEPGAPAIDPLLPPARRVNEPLPMAAPMPTAEPVLPAVSAPPRVAVPEDPAPRRLPTPSSASPVAMPKRLPTPLLPAATAVVAPKAIRNRPPAYPSQARKRGHEGTVDLDVHVLADGMVGAVEVRTTSGHGTLDRAAVRAVKRWRFEPATDDGRVVDLWIVIPIQFALQESQR